MTNAIGKAVIVKGGATTLDQAVRELLPAIGSVKVRRDPAGFEHPTHEHETDETLLIVEGSIEFFAQDVRGICQPGDRLLLPQGMRHSSIAGDQGCVYIIALH